jgi:hypothetical protein
MPRLAAAVLALALVLTEMPVPPSLAQGLGLRVEGPLITVQIAPRPSRRRVPGYYSERPPRASTRRRQLTSNEITAALQGRGFHDIVFIRHRGATHTFEATGPRGERVRLIVNSYTGTIDGVRQLGVGRKR